MPTQLETSPRRQRNSTGSSRAAYLAHFALVAAVAVSPTMGCGNDSSSSDGSGRSPMNGGNAGATSAAGGSNSKGGADSRGGADSKGGADSNRGGNTASGGSMDGRGGVSGSTSATGGAGSGGGNGTFGGTANTGGAGGKAADAGGGTAGAATTGGKTNSGGTSGAANAGGSGGASGGSTSGGSAGASSGGSGGGKSFAPCPTSASTPCAVLPLGDSITEGFGSSGGGYRVELFRQAVQNGKAITFVGSQQNGPKSVENRDFPKRHEGRGGYTIDTDAGHSGISGSITDQAIQNFHPNIVLLMIGTNDINGNVDVNGAPIRLGKLIDDITTRAPNALVVVATIIPIANDGTNGRVKTYNSALAGIVNMRANDGKHVVLLDNYAAFSKDPSYKTTLMYDYLHPNDAGYAVLGRSFYSAIGPLLTAE